MNTPLSKIFLRLLKDGTYVASIYLHLFSLLTEEGLERELTYAHSLAEGTDPYFGEASKECWFAIFHKNIRVSDYFEGCFQARKQELITEQESKELKFLRVKVRKEGYVKEGDGGEMFNQEYRRYLDLDGRKSRENLNEPINGNMSGILWNMIQIDGEELYKTLLRTFAEHKINQDDGWKIKS